ncbi:MAG: T9SS type A sorting domain-containing protein [candidate division Zixibacteria bacterium]|nr:T9SS type A sorting domain-containing protein [candidate division Zixibacteria bacterium]
MHNFNNYPKIAVFLLIPLIVLSLTGLADSADTEIYQQVRVHVPDKASVQEILSSGIAGDGMNYNFEQSYIELPVNQTEKQIIESLGYACEVLIDDLESHYASQYQNLTMGGFRTFDEIVAKLDSINTEYPTFTKIDSLGVSHEGRTIWAMKISDNVYIQEGEPEVLFTGITHAREPIGGEICIDFAEWLLDNYWSDPEAQYIVNNRQVWIVPCMNPDGYVYNQSTNPNGGGMWRKNRRNNGGSYGVDNNRNYTYNWGYDNQGSSPDPSSNTYRGPSAGSEPENQAVMLLCQMHDFAFAIHYHSGTNAVLQAWGYDNGHFTPEQHLYRKFADSLATFSGYQDVGTTWQIMYKSNGNAYDYSYGEQTSKNKIFGFTCEAGPFWPSQSQIPTLINMHRGYNIALAQLADNPYRAIEPAGPAMTEMTTDDDGDFVVSWDMVAGDESPTNYELQEVFGFNTITDGAEDGTDNWILEGFSRSSTHYSGSYSFYSGQGDCYHAVMTLETPVEITEPTDLTFYIDYDIEAGYDYGYVEVSTDGYNFDTLDTYEGDSYGWDFKSYSLDEYIGENLYIRFRYETDIGVTEPGFYVDEIYPVRTIDNITTISNNIPNPYYQILDKEIGTYYYRARAENVQGWGVYSGVEDIEVTGTGSPVSVTMTPHGTPVTVNPGGYFTFTGVLSNNTGQNVVGDVWVMLGLPGGSMYGPIQRFDNIPLGPYQTIFAESVRQDIPTFAPLGTYDYISYAGMYPSMKLDSASFEFTIEAPLRGKSDEWNLSGWFDGNQELNSIPGKFYLADNYPNPFNARTNVSFGLPVDGNVELNVYNLGGQKVATILDGYLQAGNHSVSWDASTVSSGVYFYQLKTGDEVLTKRMTLLK